MRKNLLIILCLLSGTLYAQNVPYNVNKKKFPLGEDFRKLLPLEVGNWSRFAFHDYLPGQENGSVYYENGNKQIYILFGKAIDQNDMKIVWTKIYDNATDGKQDQVKQKNMTTSAPTKYFLMDGKQFLYAWTRNLYYFSVSTKQKPDADDFMKSFPW